MARVSRAAVVITHFMRENEILRDENCWLRIALPAAVALVALPIVPFVLPILPTDTFLHYQSAIGLEPPRTGAILQLQAQFSAEQDVTGGVEGAIRERHLESAHQNSHVFRVRHPSSVKPPRRAWISSAPTARTTGPCGVLR